MKLPPLEMLAKHDRDLCEQYSEQQAKAIPMGDSLLCRVLGKYLLYVDPADLSMTPHLAMLGHWEMWVTMAIARNVPRGGRYIDVGAAYGYYTVLLADLAGETGRVIALEPNAVQRQRLRRTLAVNGYDLRHAADMEYAAWDTKDTISFYNDRERVGCSAALDYCDSSASDVDVTEVRTLPLDTVFVPNFPIDFVKIDAEGAEARVWDGMRLLRGHANSPHLQILLELTPSKHADGGRRILEEALAEGFQLSEVGTEGQLVQRTVDELIRTEGPDLRMIWMKR